MHKAKHETNTQKSLKSGSKESQTTTQKTLIKKVLRHQKQLLKLPVSIYPPGILNLQ